jgi:hypothetical protein
MYILLLNKFISRDKKIYLWFRILWCTDCYSINSFLVIKRYIYDLEYCDKITNVQITTQ